jgi:hypothetical protein
VSSGSSSAQSPEINCRHPAKDPRTLTEELDKLASLTTAILLEIGAVISANPFKAGAHRARTAFMKIGARTASIYETGNCRLSGKGEAVP